MKRIVFCIAAIIFVASCAKESTQITSGSQVEVKSFVIRAKAEKNPTKATYTVNGDKASLVWAIGDQIGVNMWKEGDNHWPEPLTLKSGEGTSEGVFYEANTNNIDDSFYWGDVAFYPHNGYADGNADNDGTNYNPDEHNLYVHLKPEIVYNANSHPMPLAAYLGDGRKTTDVETETNIEFKHLGAGIKMTVKDVPVGANKISLTVPGKSITGWYGFAIGANGANIGVNSISGSNLTNAGSTVTYTFAATTTVQDMTFVFPMPVTEVPGLEMRLYVEGESSPYGIRTAPAQPNLDRGTLLEMQSDLTFSAPSYLYILDNTGWSNGRALYLAKGSDPYLGDWPGDVSTVTYATSYTGGDNYNYYRFSVPKKYWHTSDVLMIFNNANNGSQTGDLSVALSGSDQYFLTDGSVVSNISQPLVRLYFKTNDSNYLHIWTDGDDNFPDTTWPGNKLTSSTTIGGDTYFYKDFAPSVILGKSIKMVYNNNGDWQTGNSGPFTLSGDHEFFFEVHADRVEKIAKPI